MSGMAPPDVSAGSRARLVASSRPLHAVAMEQRQPPLRVQGDHGVEVRA